MKIIEHIILLKFCSLELFGMLPLLSSSLQSFLFFCQQAASWWKCCIHYMMSGTTLSTGASFYEWIKTMIANCIWGRKKKIERRNFKQYLNNFLMFSSCWKNSMWRNFRANKIILSKDYFQCWLFDNGDKEKSFSSWFLHFSLAL